MKFFNILLFILRFIINLGVTIAVLLVTFFILKYMEDKQFIAYTSDVTEFAIKLSFVFLWLQISDKLYIK